MAPKVNLPTINLLPSLTLDLQ